MGHRWNPQTAQEASLKAHPPGDHYYVHLENRIRWFPHRVAAMDWLTEQRPKTSVPNMVPIYDANGVLVVMAARGRDGRFRRA